MTTKKGAAGERARRTFGSRVRVLRLARDHSQERLAELAGLHRNYIGGVERGEINLTLENVYAIAAGLQVDVIALFDGSDEVRGNKRRSTRRARERRS